MNRLTDHDKTYGPLTIAKCSWKRFSIILSSETEEGDDRNLPNTLTIYAFGWIARLLLPSIIKPFAEKVQAGWDADTVKRLGRDHYFNFYDREYGFSLSDGDFFQLHYGIQAGFGNLPKGVKEQSWCKHLPWKMWDHVRHSLYNLDGSHFWTEPKRKKGERYSFAPWEKAKEEVPKAHFKFKDYDGQEIIATCYIEEREWHKGEAWFKWLKYFTKPKIRRSLDLAFNEEVGPQKGSWKGGTIGTGCDMKDGETPEQAFRRYCTMDHERKGRKFHLTFIGPCEVPPKKVYPQIAEDDGSVTSAEAKS